MTTPQQAIQTQLANIQTRTGKTLAQLHAVLKKSKLEKHGELVKLLKAELGMGHGDANTVVHTFRAGADGATTQSVTADDVLAVIYSGTKAPLRALHEAMMAQIEKFGEFEVAPKKAYVSLRRKKQFAMVGPGSKARLEIGINHKELAATDRLLAQPAGGMCQFKVFVSERGEIDKQLLNWIRAAYDGAG